MAVVDGARSNAPVDYRAADVFSDDFARQSFGSM